ncbi:MAG: glycoside hydrolase family 3 C-terminal domain-containing protein, partial [Huintestinicola sp.]
ALETLCPDTQFEFIPTDSADEKALAAAKGAETVILALGEDQLGTGESRSCADISLPDEQKRLFEEICGVNKNTIVLLFGGRPLAIPELAEKAAAILELWLPGTAGCLAAADILSGKISPSGKLSMSFPYCTGQLPISYSAFNTGRPKDNRVKEFIPFLSNYMDAPNIPLYPFGYGLSYTSFEYSPVSLDNDTLSAGGRINANVKVRNTGDRVGKEAVQLYIRDVKGSVVRPMRELKGFKKISLAPGEEQTVSFEITEDMLKFYDINMEHIAEKGSFILFIGSDSTTENSAEFRLI